MTIEKFKSFPNCRHYTDEQAQEILQTLENLAVILFDFTGFKNGTIIDNQQVIDENINDNQKNAA